MKKFIKYLFLIFIVLLISELLFGYAIFLKRNKSEHNTYHSSIYKVSRYFYSIINKNNLDEQEAYPQLELSDNLKNDNIFIVTPKDRNMLKFHPFVDFSNVYGVYNFDIDFFGYRNNFNYNFDPKEFRILMTGGSECAGYTHKEPIAFLLEKKLREYYSSKKIKIINLCMNAYTLAYEIQSFVHLGWYIKPNLVISHTGWNDAYSFSLVPKKFGELGLVYTISQEEWMYRFYSMNNPNTTNYENLDPFIKNNDQEMFIDSIKFTLNKYNTLVNSSNADFLVGLQPYNILPHQKPVSPGKHKNILYSYMEILTKEFEYLGLNVINFAKDNKIYKFKDSIHTTHNTANLIAEKYFDYIVKNYNEKIEKIIKK